MIQVIQRALDIMEYVSKDRRREYSLGEIADHLKLNHSTCANIIKTLVERNYMEQKAKRQGYRLGSQAYFLTGNFSDKSDLLSVSIEPIKKLRTKLNESCLLAILRENMRHTLYLEQSTHELQVINTGQEKNIYLTATGRVMLACMLPEDQDLFINRFGIPDRVQWPEVSSVNELKAELDKIREKHLAIHFAESFIVGIGVPVYRKGRMIAALGVYLPQVRLTYKTQEQIFLGIKATGRLISKELDKLSTLRSSVQ